MSKRDVKIYSIYNTPDVSGFKCEGESMTQQQFKDECDINNIVDYNMRYKDPAFMTKLQLAGKISLAKPIYGDFSNVEDYQTSIEIVRNAQQQFASLPAKVRARFGNDPAQMLSFVSDEANFDECVSLGLIEKNDAVHMHQVSDVTNVENAGSDAVSTPVQETSAQPLT